MAKGRITQVIIKISPTEWIMNGTDAHSSLSDSTRCVKTGLQKGRDYVSRRMSDVSDDDRLALVLVQRQKISVFHERNRK